MDFVDVMKGGAFLWVVQYMRLVGMFYFHGARFATALDWMAVIITLRPVIWTAVEAMFGEMRKSGESEFTSPKISRIRAHLEEGGEIWIRAGDADIRNTSAIQHGGHDLPRTHKDGCVLSVKPTGGGMRYGRH